MVLRRWRTEHMMWFVCAIIAFIVLVVLLAFIPLHQWLWLGWLYGVSAIVVGHGLSTLLLYLILRKFHSKAQGIIISLGKTTLNFAFQGGCFLATIVINNVYAGDAPFTKSLDNLVAGPIAFPTYLVGVGIVMLSTFISLLVDRHLSNRKIKEV